MARELTKLHEEVRRGTPDELAQWAAEATPKGEMVILVGPPLAEAVTDETIVARLAAAARGHEPQRRGADRGARSWACRGRASTTSAWH